MAERLFDRWNGGLDMDRPVIFKWDGQWYVDSSPNAPTDDGSFWADTHAKAVAWLIENDPRAEKKA